VKILSLEAELFHALEKTRDDFAKVVFYKFGDRA